MTAVSEGSVSRGSDHASLTTFQLLHMIFGATVVVWLNQILQIITDLSMRRIGMYTVLLIVVIFVLGAIPPTAFLENILKRQFIDATRTVYRTFSATAKLCLSVVSCGILAMGYSFCISGDFIFSLTFLVAFIVLLGTDIILLRSGQSG